MLGRKLRAILAILQTESELSLREPGRRRCYLKYPAKLLLDWVSQQGLAMSRLIEGSL